MTQSTTDIATNEIYSNQGSHELFVNNDETVIFDDLLCNNNNNNKNKQDFNRTKDRESTSSKQELVEREICSEVELTEDDNNNNLELQSTQFNQTLEISKTRTSIHNLVIENSNDVQVGDAVIYNGPVTIQQYVVKENGSSFKKKISLNKEFLKDFLQWRKHLLCKSLTFLGVIILVLVTVFVSLKFSKADNQELENGVSASSTLRIIPRQEWFGRAPNYTRTLASELPINRTIIAHTVTESCSNLETCSLRVREIQNFHMNNYKWGDIGYNFLIGGDGFVYEGRGWMMEGVHTFKFNKRSIGVAFIGDFRLELPPKKSLDACKLLFDLGVTLKFLRPNYKLFGHRQLTDIESPGEALYQEIKTWPHWSANVYGE